jgi:hypothetical protein
MSVSLPRSLLPKGFPKLKADNSRVTSLPTSSYNCIAWAAGETHRWWQPDVPYGLYYWPSKAPKSMQPAALIAAFEAIEYSPCKDGALEEGYEKVVLYERDGRWTHAARQLADGTWTSKLGSGVDIMHKAPELVDDTYGSVTCFMKRKKRS